MEENNKKVIEPVKVVCIKSVQNSFVPPISTSKAQRMINLFRDANPKKEHQIYTMVEFYSYYGLI